MLDFKHIHCQEHVCLHFVLEMRRLALKGLHGEGALLTTEDKYPFG